MPAFLNSGRSDHLKPEKLRGSFRPQAALNVLGDYVTHWRLFQDLLNLFLAVIVSGLSRRVDVIVSNKYASDGSNVAADGCDLNVMPSSSAII